MAAISAFLFALLASSTLAQSQSFNSSSAPAIGQYARYRGAPRGSLLSIVPVDGATFLAGQRFDISVEMHSLSASSLPSLDGLTTSIGSATLDSYFSSNWTKESWNYTYIPDAASFAAGNTTRVYVARWALRGVYFKSAGDFTVSLSNSNYNVSAGWNVRSYNNRQAKNVVLMIGDGMAPTMISAARYLSRATKFGKFNKNILNMEALGTIGKIMTNGIDAIITDSANSAHAYTTGHKSWVNALGVYADTSSPTFDDPKVETIAEIIRRERPNMCIGVVTTAEIQDATPAAVWSHTRSRNDKADITRQQIYGWPSAKYNYTWDAKAVKADVLMGGGGEFFCANVNATSGGLVKFCNPYSSGGKPVDVYNEYKTKFNYTIVSNANELAAYNGTGPLLGIFALNHMDTWIDRNVYTVNTANNAGSDPTGNGGAAGNQPNLDKMTAKAIEVLDKRCTDGFFLLVEGASIDKAMHPLDFDRGLADVLELDATVKVVTDYAATNNQTAIFLTADHAQGYDVAGTVDMEFYTATGNDDTGNFVIKRKAVGNYQAAGWPDPVIDANGLPSRWDNRFRLYQSKVDSPGYNEENKLTITPQASNPLARVPAVSNTTLLSAERNISGTFYAANVNDQPNGIPRPATLAPDQSTSVHTLQAVDLYCRGPTAAKCAAVMDNTELFFLLADTLGLGATAANSANSALGRPSMFVAVVVAVVVSFLFA
ncbi:alkaline-phosphatase-like protein [Cladochytrium replicatum]|nr:alkaline-phosphatase-like protein [Cladochytrium replicatum]